QLREDRLHLLEEEPVPMAADERPQLVLPQPGETRLEPEQADDLRIDVGLVDRATMCAPLEGSPSRLPGRGNGRGPVVGGPADSGCAQDCHDRGGLVPGETG